MSLLSAILWIQIQATAVAAIEQLRTSAEYNLLGAGEQESIALALDFCNATLLCSDNRARWLAQSVGTQVANIAAFLLACKVGEIVDHAEMKLIVEDLARLDY